MLIPDNGRPRFQIWRYQRNGLRFLSAVPEAGAHARKEPGTDANVEALFRSPRPHLGTSISTGMALHDGFLRPADPDRAALVFRRRPRVT